MEKYDIFISYRRNGGKIAANHIHFALTGKGYRVFLDTDDLGGGDFDLALFDIIRNCKDFMIILSPDALDECNKSNDWIRKELICALENKKNIIPVRMEGFSFPKELPKEIDSIRVKNCFIYDVTHFTVDIKKLEKKFLKSKPVVLIRKIIIAICMILVAAGLIIYLAKSFSSMDDKITKPNSTAAIVLQSIPTDNQDTVMDTQSNTPDPSNIIIGSMSGESSGSFEVDVKILENGTESLQIPTKNVIITY